jgi:lipoate-protein ligase A
VSVAGRLIDTGARPARWNLAMTAALATAHRPDTREITLRFQRFPPSVLIGRHQRLGEVVDVERCRRLGVEIARRPTGGGAVYMAPGILAWDVVADRQRFGGRLPRAAAAIGGGVALGLSRLGAEAEFSPPGDVRCRGRKLCGTSGYVEGAAIVFQGTVLIEFDPKAMAEFLVVPGMTAATLAGELIGLGEALGRSPRAGEVEAALADGIAAALGVNFANDEPRTEESALADRLYAIEYGTDAFVAGEEAA